MAFAAMDETFNSSDIELPEEAPQPVNNYGRKSIESMIAHAFEDRVQSKIASKTLRQVEGSPSAEATRKLWSARFQAYLNSKPSHKPESVPTAEDLERFFLIFPKHIILSSVGGMPAQRQAVGYHGIQAGVNHLVKALIFQYKTFHLDARDASRLHNVLQQQLKEGILTKDAARADKFWIGAALIKKIARTMLEDALRNGTKSWDVTIQQVAGAVMQSATCGRAGDIVYSPRYKKGEYLKYGDIRVTLVTKNGVQKFRTIVVLKHTKGNKNQGRNNHPCTFDELGPGFSMVDPGTLLIILGHRTGNLRKTWLQDMNNHPNKLIDWLYPDRPVFCGYAPQGFGLDPTRPCPSDRFQRTLEFAADLLGITAPIRTHDIRRGAASDLARRVKPAMACSMAEVGVSLNHTDGSIRRGVTASYVGRIQVDKWKDRVVDDGLNDTDDLDAPPMASHAYKRKRLRGDDVMIACSEAGVDYEDESKRRKVIRELHAADKKEHYTAHSLRWSDKDTTAVVANLTIDESGVPTNQAVESGAHVAYPPNHRGLQESLNESLAPCEPDPQLQAIDPVLLEHDERLGILQGCLFSSDQDETSGVNSAVDLQDVLQFDPVQSMTAEIMPELTAPTLDFISFFSKINLVKYERERPMHHITEGSADVPTPFPWPCTNAIHGCKRTSDDKRRHDSHVQSCKYTSAEAGLAFMEQRSFVCTGHAPCISAFSSATDLRNHKQRVHKKANWKSRKCHVKGCTSTKIFTSPQTLATHMTDCHSDWKSRTCEVCSDGKIYESRKRYITHLEKHVKTGDITEERKNALLPAKSKPRPEHGPGPFAAVNFE